jgi:hypothetical protein
VSWVYDGVDRVHGADAQGLWLYIKLRPSVLGWAFKIESVEGVCMF